MGPKLRLLLLLLHLPLLPPYHHLYLHLTAGPSASSRRRSRHSRHPRASAPEPPMVPRPVGSPSAAAALLVPGGTGSGQPPPLGDVAVEGDLPVGGAHRTRLSDQAPDAPFSRAGRRRLRAWSCRPRPAPVAGDAVEGPEVERRGDARRREPSRKGWRRSRRDKGHGSRLKVTRKQPRINNLWRKKSYTVVSEKMTFNHFRINLTFSCRPKTKKKRTSPFLLVMNTLTTINVDV